MFFCNETQGFYLGDIGPVPPDGSIEISEEVYEQVLGFRSSGFLVSVSTDGTITTKKPQISEADIVKLQIIELEKTQTARRMREAVLGVDGGWMENLDAQISALRAQLN